MPNELVRLYADQNPEGLRVSRPSKFIFLCGGMLAPTVGRKKPLNLRDYLYRCRPIRTPYEIVLAEKASQLYRDTNYGDLISFEEDIARIAAIVLVIAEGAGSLAELGAFASSVPFRQSLRVIVPEHYANEESFVRYGPIERIQNEKRDFVGVYPWRNHSKNGHLVVASVKPHYAEIVRFINDHTAAVPDSTKFSNLGEAKLFYVIYWIVYISFAVSTSTLYDFVNLIRPDVSRQEIKNKLYCMKLAGWIEQISYSGKDYFFAQFDEDPFSYSFAADVDETDSVRRKMEVRTQISNIEKVPKHVIKVARDSRRSVKR